MMDHDMPISAQFIATVIESLQRREPVRQRLPGWGRLHIDRRLPFLCIYRRPPGDRDPGTARLVLGEAAYLRASGEATQQAGLATLVAEIARCQGEAFGAFLLLELWAGGAAEAYARPAFEIHAARHEVPGVILETLENTLLAVRPDGRKPEVRLSYDGAPHPPGLSPLMNGQGIAGLQLVRVGLEIRPVYRDSDTGALFPFELRSLHHGLARALKRSFFAFTHACTPERPAHYQELGRRAMTKAVWKTDRQLAEISEQFDLLLHVSPVNSAQAWEVFQQRKYEREVDFLYRPRPVNPGLLKRRLYEIPVERIEDPTLAHIFEAKRDELDRQITLVADRNTPRFLLGSRQLFGDIEPALSNVADQLLAKDPAAGADDPDPVLKAQALAEHARAQISAYRQQDPSLASRVELRDDVPGILVSQGNFLIGRDAQVTQSRLEATLAHEIGTHVLTYHNGRQQPFRELYTGMAGYESMQEGLAVVGEYLVDGLRLSRLRLLAARVVAVSCISEGAGFIDTFRRLHQQHGLTAYQAFTVTMRVFRGGGYTKDIVYLRGLIQLLHYLAEGNELEPLYIGKISAEHLPFVEELRWRRVLRPPGLTPVFLSDSAARGRLAALKRGMSVLDLAEAVS
jgi:uncharacterized protein (TIGR02421 family)